MCDLGWGLTRAEVVAGVCEWSFWWRDNLRGQQLKTEMSLSETTDRLFQRCIAVDLKAMVSS